MPLRALAGHLAKTSPHGTLLDTLGQELDDARRQFGAVLRDDGAFQSDDIQRVGDDRGGRVQRPLQSVRYGIFAQITVEVWPSGGTGDS